MKKLAPLVVGVALAAGLAGAAGAQEDAASLLPAPEAIGDGWTKVVALPADEDLNPAFSDAVYGVYVGPDGARAIVNIWVVADSMTAVRQSWEVTGGAFDYFRDQIDYDNDYDREETIAPTPLPDGCADARRTFGVEEVGFRQFPVGITLCAADPDKLILVYASGPVAGRTEHMASDFLASLAASQQASTPVPE